VADEVQVSPGGGWYEDPTDPTKLHERYWDGSQWTGRVRMRGTREEVAEPETREAQAVAPRSAARPEAVRLPAWFWVLLIVATLGILWGAAEQHDQGCYNKALVQAASGNTNQANCLLLPWNDPAEGNSAFQ
jgi:hypothetical protein